MLFLIKPKTARVRARPKPAPSQRREYDQYETPLAVAQQGVRWLFDECLVGHGDPLPSHINVLEPGCGTAAPFLHAVTDLRPCSCDGIELQGGSALRTALARAPAEMQQRAIVLNFGIDYLTWTPRVPYDLILTNPPFSLAEEFIRKTVTLLQPYGVAMFLLRLGFLASIKRYKLWTRDISLHYTGILTQRPSFIGGTDVKTDYAWYVFTQKRTCQVKTETKWLPPLAKAA